MHWQSTKPGIKLTYKKIIKKQQARAPVALEEMEPQLLLHVFRSLSRPGHGDPVQPTPRRPCCGVFPPTSLHYILRLWVQANDDEDQDNQSTDGHNEHNPDDNRSGGYKLCPVLQEFSWQPRVLSGTLIFIVFYNALTIRWILLIG